jgi:kanamycin nucleotidyltransferase
MPGGPQPMDHSHRLELAREIAGRFQAHYGESVLALGVYGSLARGTDGPYSDIELLCVLRGEGIEQNHEWSAGAWKAEVNVRSQDVALREAAELDVDWPITHGAFTHVLPLRDPEAFFPRLRDAALAHSDDEFRQVMCDVIVGEVYERVGKARNARAEGNAACLPALALDLAKMGACLIGLAQRHVYATSARMFSESLALPGAPAGYAELCRLVMSGELADAARNVDVIEAFWAGVEQWAQERSLVMVQDLSW